jgi:hypothetical protein
MSRGRLLSRRHKEVAELHPAPREQLGIPTNPGVVIPWVSRSELMLDLEPAMLPCRPAVSPRPQR